MPGYCDELYKLAVRSKQSSRISFFLIAIWTTHFPKQIVGQSGSSFAAAANGGIKLLHPAYKHISVTTITVNPVNPGNPRNSNDNTTTTKKSPIQRRGGD